MGVDILGSAHLRDGCYNLGKRGTVAAATKSVEKGDGWHNLTVLTVNTTIGPINTGSSATANVGQGVKIYTFPAGTILVRGAYMKMALVDDETYVAADTPEIGLGTVKAAGAAATLGATATFEDIMEGAAVADCSGTDYEAYKSATTTPLLIKSGDAHTVHLNVANAWAASGASSLPASGTVVLDWVWLK